MYVSSLVPLWYSLLEAVPREGNGLWQLLLDNLLQNRKKQSLEKVSPLSLSSPNAVEVINPVFDSVKSCSQKVLWNVLALKGQKGSMKPQLWANATCHNNWFPGVSDKQA